jgi:hypothetical protein
MGMIGSFGISWTNNDMNVLNKNPILCNYLNKEVSSLIFILKKRTYPSNYLLTNSVYHS